MPQPIEYFEREEESTRMVFLDATVELIDNVNEARWLLSYEDMRDPLDSVWEEARGRYESNRDGIREWITRKLSDEDLAVYGLSGAQWEAKYRGFSNAYRGLWHRGGLRLLKRVLKWINNILSSLIAALSPSLDFLKEMKDLVEAVMDDTLDPAGHWM